MFQLEVQSKASTNRICRREGQLYAVEGHHIHGPWLRIEIEARSIDCFNSAYSIRDVYSEETCLIYSRTQWRKLKSKAHMNGWHHVACLGTNSRHYQDSSLRIMILSLVNMIGFPRFLGLRPDLDVRFP